MTRRVGIVSFAPSYSDRGMIMGFLEFTPSERAVPGLRKEAPSSDVKVYKANPDGTPGKLLRIEKSNVNKKRRRGWDNDAES